MKACEKLGLECLWENIERENPEDNPVILYEKIIGINKSDYHGK